MSFWDIMRRVMKRAKDEASDVAQVANLKLEIRNLEGKRDHLLKEIGRRVCAMDDRSWRPSELDPLCSEVASVETRISRVKLDMKNRRARPAAAPDAAAPTA